MNSNIQTNQQTSCIRCRFSPDINNAIHHQNKKNYCSKSAIFLFFVIAFIFNNAFALELGVGTHFGQGKGDPAFAFQWMKSAGMSSFRDEVYWDNIEHQADVINPALDDNAHMSFQTFSEANLSGFNPILVLSYGNPLYDGGSQPYTTQGRAAFAEYAGWLAEQLNGKVNKFEIWNEWNIGFGTNPYVNHGDPVQYAQLASASYDAIKSVNPAAKVIVGAVTDDFNGWPWLTAAINAGLLKSADGVSVHLYNHNMTPSQAGASEAVNRLQTLQTLLRASNGGKPFPIYVTETGWPTHIGPGGVSENIAAEQDARLMLEAMTVEDLAGIWWYDLIDDGDNSNNQEDRFGLLRTSLEEKPAGCRLRSLAPFVKQASLVQNISNGNAQALMFKGKDGRNLLAVWAGDGYTDAVSNIQVTGSFGSVKAFDQPCGDRVIDGFKGASANAIQIQAGTYPTLVWVDSNANLTEIVLSAPTPTLNIYSYYVGNIARNSATISWVTNAPSSAVIYYGTRSTNLNYTANYNYMATSHTKSVSNLTRSTKYYYSFTAKDSANNKAYIQLISAIDKYRT